MALYKINRFQQSGSVEDKKQTDSGNLKKQTDLTSLNHKMDVTLNIRNDITTLAFYGHGSEAILFFLMGYGKVIPSLYGSRKIFFGNFAMKYDLLMFSNVPHTFDTISTFTVELKLYFCCFGFCCLPKQQQQNGRQCKHLIFLIKNIILVGEFVENQFQNSLFTHHLV